MKNLKTIIYAPNLYLFAFNLARGINSELQSQTFNQDWLINNYTHIIHHYFPNFKDEFYKGFKLKKQHKNQTEDLNITLLNNETNPNIPFLSLSQSQLPEEGVILPKQISDTYVLMLGLYHPQTKIPKNVTIDKLKEFNPNNCLNIQANLGKTLIFYAFIKEEQIDHIKTIAEESLNNLLPKENQPKLFRQDKLFDSHVFVYGNPKTNNNQTYTQILLIFFTKEENNQKFLITTYSNLPSLLLEFQKIVTAYHSGKQEYDKVFEKFNNIADLLKELKDKYNKYKTSNYKFLKEEELKELKNQLIYLLKINLQYSKIIRKMEINQSSLQINLDNYQIDLENLQREIQDNLDYFTYLQNRILPTLQKELDAKVKYVAQGVILIQEATANIRGLIEINQAEIDRTSQKLFAAIGAGIAVGGIIASSSGQVTQENPIYLRCLPDTICEIHPFIKFVGLSIVIGLLASYLIYKLWDKRKK